MPISIILYFFFTLHPSKDDQLRRDQDEAKKRGTAPLRSGSRRPIPGLAAALLAAESRCPDAGDRIPFPVILSRPSVVVVVMIVVVVVILMVIVVVVIVAVLVIVVVVPICGGGAAITVRCAAASRRCAVAVAIPPLAAGHFVAVTVGNALLLAAIPLTVLSVCVVIPVAVRCSATAILPVLAPFRGFAVSETVRCSATAVLPAAVLPAAHCRRL